MATNVTFTKTYSQSQASSSSNSFNWGVVLGNNSYRTAACNHAASSISLTISYTGTVRNATSTATTMTVTLAIAGKNGPTQKISLPPNGTQSFGVSTTWSGTSLPGIVGKISGYNGGSTNVGFNVKLTLTFPRFSAGDLLSLNSDAGKFLGASGMIIDWPLGSHNDIAHGVSWYYPNSSSRTYGGSMGSYNQIIYASNLDAVYNDFVNHF